MKTLNERSTEILKALLAVRAKKLKIKNASQTIHVKLTDCIGKYNLISLTLHIEINGVLFRDPEVIFAFNTIKCQTKNEGLYNYPFDIVCHFFYLSNNQLIQYCLTANNAGRHVTHNVTHCAQIHIFKLYNRLTFSERPK